MDQITNKESADFALKRLGELQRTQAKAKINCEESIKRARERRDKLANPLAEEAKEIEKALKAFAKKDRSKWGASRSLKLRHGMIGWRKRPSIRLPKNISAVIARLKERGLSDCINTKESVNKEVLGALSDETIKQVGAKKVITDHFYAEPAEETG